MRGDPKVAITYMPNYWLSIILVFSKMIHWFNRTCYFDEPWHIYQQRENTVRSIENGSEAIMKQNADFQEGITS